MHACRTMRLVPVARRSGHVVQRRQCVSTSSGPAARIRPVTCRQGASLKNTVKPTSSTWRYSASRIAADRMDSVTRSRASVSPRPAEPSAPSGVMVASTTRQPCFFRSVSVPAQSASISPGVSADCQHRPGLVGRAHACFLPSIGQRPPAAPVTSAMTSGGQCPVLAQTSYTRRPQSSVLFSSTKNFTYSAETD